MKAITIPDPGGPDSLVLAEVPEPTARAGEVLVEVVAAGVNRADVQQRMGLYPPPAGAPAYPGLEVSGRISEIPTDTDPGDWRVGDEVCALLSGGGYAQRVAVPVEQLLPIPAGVDLVDAAGLPEVACTVFANLFMTAKLRPGETVLIHGGSSGIGTMAIQLAGAFGARVAVTAGSAEKLAACARLGAQILVDYREQDFVEEVRSATSGNGADVVLDVVGAKYLQRNVEVLATNGRLVVIGLLGGRRAELDLGLLLTKRAAVIATSLRARPAPEKAAIVAAVRDQVWPLFHTGSDPISGISVRPVTHARYRLADAASAHRALEESGHIGKLLLLV